ncbi:MAG TPA: hypothetical protein VFV50_14435, partial [Bdellovibrionales bacterium]|nr:hypothetical protein [Bdellovibrionales bacterium]
AQASGTAGAFVSLSPYHGLEINEEIAVPYALEEQSGARAYFSRFDEIMQSAANTAFPWPKWVKTWEARIPERAAKAPAAEKKRALDL